MVCSFRSWWHSGMWSSPSLQRNGNIWIQLRGTCIGMWWWRTIATWSHWVSLSASYNLEYAVLNIRCFLVNPRLSWKKIGTFLFPVSRGTVELWVGEDTSISTFIILRDVCIFSVPSYFYFPWYPESLIWILEDIQHILWDSSYIVIESENCYKCFAIFYSTFLKNS